MSTMGQRDYQTEAEKAFNEAKAAVPTPPRRSDSGEDVEAELDTIRVCTTALGRLSLEARARVLLFLARREGV